MYPRRVLGSAKFLAIERSSKPSLVAQCDFQLRKRWPQILLPNKTSCMLLRTLSQAFGETPAASRDSSGAWSRLGPLPLLTAPSRDKNEPKKNAPTQELLAYYAQPFPWDDRVEMLNKSVFGNQSFRPCQREIINALLSKKSILAILPSGAGKSLLYQLTALCDKGVTVVLSPLVALIEDQVMSLQRLGIPARSLSGNVRPQMLFKTLEEMRYEDVPFKVLYVTPERLTSNKHILEQNGNLQAVVVDEAHCITEWGHEFRPDYRRLSTIRNTFPNTPILALTGTCTLDTQDDILTQLRIKNSPVFRTSSNRPNLWLEIRHRESSDVASEIADYLQSHNVTFESGIVYCLTRRDAVQMAQDLAARGFNCKPYHAELSHAERALAQQEWKEGTVPILCSTVAFGLGIDKPNVRFVLHACLPTSIEAYYQQIGRAGRDGLPAHTAVFFTFKDRSRVQAVIRAPSGDDDLIDREVVSLKEDKLDAMISYCMSEVCRREFLMKYFGEKIECTQAEDLCDMCIVLRQRKLRQLEKEKILREKKKASASFNSDDGIPVVLREEAEIEEGRISPVLHSSNVPQEDRGESDRIESRPERDFSRLGLSPNSAMSQGDADDGQIAEEDIENMDNNSALFQTPPAIAYRTATIFRPNSASHSPQNGSKSRLSNPALSTRSAIESILASTSTATPLKRHKQQAQLALLIDDAARNILSRTSVRTIMRTKPETIAELSAIKGVGKQKASIVGHRVLKVLKDWYSPNNDTE